MISIAYRRKDICAWVGAVTSCRAINWKHAAVSFLLKFWRRRLWAVRNALKRLQNEIKLKSVLESFWSFFVPSANFQSKNKQKHFSFCNIFSMIEMWSEIKKTKENVFLIEGKIKSVKAEKREKLKK